MARALAFYRLLGLDIPAGADGEAFVNVEDGPGLAVGFMLETMVAGSPLGWVEPVGGRMSLAFKCDGAAEVDERHARMVAAGHPGVMGPVDSPYGQRYACLRDPDGNRVDLFAAL